MVSNDLDTTGLYCPMSGFNPPCGICLWAIEGNSGKCACAIANLGLDTKALVWIKNVVEKKGV